MSISWTRTPAPCAGLRLLLVARAAGHLLPGLVAALAVGCADRNPTEPPHTAAIARSMAGGGGQPSHYPEPAWPMDFPAGSVCAFELVATPVQNNSLVTQYPADSNGDVLMRVTGLYVEQLTNAGSGKSMTVNISGPLSFTIHPDGSTTVVADGPTQLWFYATDTPPSRFLVVNGHAVLYFSPSGQETLQSFSGTQTDVCAALS